MVSGTSVAYELYRTREGVVRGGSTGIPGIGYRAIADALREEIDAGKLPPGSKVPGENELMNTYGVEQPTARRALDVLKNEGLIIARRGAGTFVREFRLYRRRSPAPCRVGLGSGRSIWASDDAERQTSVDTI
jgi:GntR family transcriptional regulator